MPAPGLKFLLILPNASEDDSSYTRCTVEPLLEGDLYDLYPPDHDPFEAAHFWQWVGAARAGDTLLLSLDSYTVGVVVAVPEAASATVFADLLAVSRAAQEAVADQMVEP